jgi:Immunity protein 8
MKLEIQTIWSPDLDPPSGGTPEDNENFDIWVQVSLGEIGKPGSEVFGLSVTSPEALASKKQERFLSHVLVLNCFSWEIIRKKIEKLLSHTQGCDSWEDVIITLTGLLDYSDQK